MKRPQHDAEGRSGPGDGVPNEAALREELAASDPADAGALRALIEGEIIPRLLASHGVPARAPVREATLDRHADADAFADLAINADLEDLLAFVDGCRRNGLAADDVFTAIVAPAARRLGVFWEQDICSFTDVTVALGKLHQVVHRLGGLAHRRVEAGRNAPAILLAPFPGEQHTLGLAIVAEAFRDSGWTVFEETEVPAARLIDRVRQTRLEAVGLTLATDAALDAVPALIQALRRASANRALVVLVGGWRFSANPALALKCGADGTAETARQAVKRAGELLDAHAARV